MNVQLSWDLFIIVFFIIIVAYSLIIGRDNTLKVILGTYISALTADAIGNIFGKYFAGSEGFINILRLLQIGTEKETVVFVKILVFITMVILFAVKGAFSVSTMKEKSGVICLILSSVYAVMSAGLVISVILVFVSGVSFVSGAQTASVTLTDIYNESVLVKSMVSNSYVWFSLPAITFLIHSLYSPQD